MKDRLDELNQQGSESCEKKFAECGEFFDKTAAVCRSFEWKEEDEKVAKETLEKVMEEKGKLGKIQEKYFEAKEKVFSASGR